MCLQLLNIHTFVHVTMKLCNGSSCIVVIEWYILRTTIVCLHVSDTKQSTILIIRMLIEIQLYCKVTMTM